MGYSGFPRRPTLSRHLLNCIIGKFRRRGRTATQTNHRMSTLSKGKPVRCLLSYFRSRLNPFSTSPSTVSQPHLPFRLNYFSGSFPFPPETRPPSSFSRIVLPFSSIGFSNFRLPYAFDQFLGRDGTCFRYLATSSCGSRAMAKREEALQIVELVKRDGAELESKLDSLNLRLSVASVAEVFAVLNEEKVSGLRFFSWFRQWQPELARNSDVCSLIIDNCGHLEDYVAMRCILDEFRLNMICLSKWAFEFLYSETLDEHGLSKSTRKVIAQLHEVGGSCCSSGIHSLVEFFCGLGSFGMAKFVVENTERKLSYYTVLIKGMCKMYEFKAARDVLNEMKKEGCEDGVQAFNHVISSLCKFDHADAWEVFREMTDANCVPDALTFEILICDSCRHGKFEVAFQLLDDMETTGLEPRLSTHAVIIKELFRLQRHEEAYTYVVNASKKYKSSANMSFSLLASLHEKKRNVVIAQSIISEMIEKGLRPDYNVYLRVLKRIRKSGRAESAYELQQQFLQLESGSQKCNA